MNLEVRTMLENMYDLMTVKVNDSVKSWDRFVEFLAADNSQALYFQLKPNLDWFLGDESFATELMKLYNPHLLKSDYYDHLGEIYTERIVSRNDVKRKGIYLTPMHISEMISKMTIGETDERINVLDPAVGSGRLLMSAYKVAPNGRFFGVDLDMRLLRIAMTNFAIHNIPGYFLHANSLKHEIDISKTGGRANWKYMNRWNSHLEDLVVTNKDQNYTLKLS